ncbi:MAG TPA: ABC transporter ATP-binding protein [Candidatus Competibacteraceae bacterium]|nr:ABC transporter ATP-binding protein [Candidatus Competibacteraceae bacterium]
MRDTAESTPLMARLRNVGAYYWLRKGYLRHERYWALRDVSFDLYPGDSLGVIGRNGAGKSTLLKLLSGIVKPDLGSAELFGHHATLLSLQVGFVPYLSGRENAILSGMLMGMHRDEMERRMGEIIAFSELDEFIDQPISSYSAGMRARLGFSVAIQLDPDILLIDEVLGVGDAQFQAKSSARIHDIIRSRKTVVLVSHNADTLRKLCNRAIWLEGGVTRAVGDTDSVLREYNDYMLQTAG